MTMKATIHNIRKDTTVKIWAAKHGFNYQTVIKVFNGFVGKREIGIAGEIIEQARKDGYLEKDAA